ncbi:MAG: tetratricopeptide repeat protein [Candidatus Dormibacteraeota bacterium]|nr:tetratricopeptide repeat protein [Candidatus Dormibacteraeota bacterium]
MAPSEPAALRTGRARAQRGVERALARVVTLTERGRRAEGDLIGAKEAMDAGRWQDAARGWIGARRHPLPTVRATADLMLGLVLTDHLGQPDHGMHALDSAWRSNRPGVADAAAWRLAELNAERGDGARAHRFYDWTWRNGRSALRWKAAAALIRLLRAEGDDAGATRLFASVDRAAAAANSAEGWATLATLCRQQGDLDRAEAGYRAALDAGAGDAAALHGLLGLVLSRQGRSAAALPELEVAVAGDTTGRIWFQYELGKVQERLGHRDQACDAYSDVLQVTDDELSRLQEQDEPGRDTVIRSDPRPRAAIRLGRLRESMGEVDAARDALAYATDHGTTSVAAAAWLARARLERRVGDRSAARAGYANAIHVKGGAYPAAELGLAQLLIVANQSAAAQQILDRLVGCGDQRIASLAAVQRGELLSALGDTAAARASYEAALAGPLSAGVRARVEQALSR